MKNLVTLRDIVFHKKGSAFKSSSFQGEGIPVVRVSDFTLDSINPNNVLYVNDEVAEQNSDVKLYTNDIVIQTVGSWPNNPASVVGKVIRVPKYLNNSLLNQNAVILRTNNDFNQIYLYYLLKSSLFSKFIINYAQGAANQASITLDSIFRFSFEKIDFLSQKKIAAVLSAYDDLIENNKKRIQILENMAEELYKEWFVRFRFQNWENTEFEKGVPKDWNIINSGEFVDVVKGKSYTSPEIHDEFIDESLPFVNLKNFNRGGGYRRNGLKFYTGRYADNQKTYPEDIVMAVTDMTQDRAVVGRVARVPNLNFEFAIISLDCVKLVPKIYSSTFTYCYFKYSGFSEYIKEFANGANVLHLSPNQIGKQKILIPPKQLVDSFEAIVVPIYSELNILEESNEKLEIMRNNLLPRLISGKLSVENLDIKFPPSMQEQ